MSGHVYDLEMTTEGSHPTHRYRLEIHCPPDGFRVPNLIDGWPEDGITAVVLPCHDHMESGYVAAMRYRTVRVPVTSGCSTPTTTPDHDGGHHG